MKRHFLITALLLNAALAFAMDENQENYQDSKPIVIKSIEDQHLAFADKITEHLNKVEKALATNALETGFNVNVNFHAAYRTFYRWLNLFNQTADQDTAKEFLRHMRNRFVRFKGILDESKASANEDFPATHPHTFQLNLAIQKLVDKYSN